MRTTIGSALLLAGLAGCGSVDGDAKTSEPTASSSQFLVWNPAAALVNEHKAWHSPGCGKSGQRKCTLRGEDFLIFHRNFTKRLREEYERQGLTADISPWYAVPPEITGSRYWTDDDRNAERAVFTMIDPITNQRFASLDRFGTYLEGFYHGQLHTIGAAVYGESPLGDAGVSPRSTYFFKIHGYIDWHFSRFINGDFNRDGMSDLIAYDSADKKRGFLKMNGTNFEIGNFLIPPLPANCNWYLGASADVDFNGSLDLIFHAPNCVRTIAQLMRGDQPYSPLSIVEMNGVGSGWTLIGSGDFDADARPDLVWSNGVDVVIWFMKGTTIKGDRVVDVPDGYTPSIVGDVDGNGRADLVVRKATPDGGVDWYVMHGGTGSPILLSGLSRNPYRSPIAIGYFWGANNTTLSGQTRRQADIFFEGWSPGARSPFYGFALSNSASVGGSAVYGEVAFSNPVSTWSYGGPR